MLIEFKFVLTREKFMDNPVANSSLVLYQTENRQTANRSSASNSYFHS